MKIMSPKQEQSLQPHKAAYITIKYRIIYSINEASYTWESSHLNKHTSGILN